MHEGPGARIAALVDGDEPALRARRLASFEQAFALVVATEYWLRALPKWGQLGAHYVVLLAVASVACVAIARAPRPPGAPSSRSRRRTSSCCGASFPASGNHAYLELYVCLLAGAAAPRRHRREPARPARAALARGDRAVLLGRAEAGARLLAERRVPRVLARQRDLPRAPRLAAAGGRARPHLRACAARSATARTASRARRCSLLANATWIGGDPARRRRSAGAGRARRRCCSRCSSCWRSSWWRARSSSGWSSRARSCCSPGAICRLRPARAGVVLALVLLALVRLGVLPELAFY